MTGELRTVEDGRKVAMNKIREVHGQVSPADFQLILDAVDEDTRTEIKKELDLKS